MIYFLVFWVVGMVLGYGLTLGAFDSRWPYHKNFWFAFFAGLIFGPLNVIPALVIGPFKFRFLPPNKAERLEAAKKEYPSYSIEFYEELVA